MLKDPRILGSAPNSGYRLNISELVRISWKDMQRENINNNNNIISVETRCKTSLRHKSYNKTCCGKIFYLDGKNYYFQSPKFDTSNFLTLKFCRCFCLILQFYLLTWIKFIIIKKAVFTTLLQTNLNLQTPKIGESITNSFFKATKESDAGSFLPISQFWIPRLFSLAIFYRCWLLVAPLG